jgi:hypothetical protein
MLKLYTFFISLSYIGDFLLSFTYFFYTELRLILKENRFLEKAAGAAWGTDEFIDDY